MTTQNWTSKTVSPGAGTSASTASRRGTNGVSTGVGAPKAAPTHEQIAARAKAIWQAKGCPAGRDEENWREAEAELKGSAGRK